MRRLAAIALLAVAVPVLLVASLGATEPAGSTYEVRAIFDNASFLTPGEDVKVGGVEVGKITRLGVTKDKRAAVTLDISKAGFYPFHKDAHCSIRPLSLIGERYVECTPGSDKTGEIPAIADGKPGAGGHLLERTSSPVDLDLVNNIMRLPYRQRFAIIINEFGTALAGRGRALNEAIHRANPALRETDKVLRILARQNRVLADLAADSDAVIEPLAQRRKRISHFIVAANDTARATAERSADIERSFERLPVFLNELRPLLVDLGNTSEEMTPVLADLDRAAPDLNRFITALGPFARAGTPALESLGDATVIGRPALIDSLPLVRRLGRFARDAGPVGRNLARFTRSFDETGGVERFMDYIFFQMMGINGFDGVSHYLRAGLLTNTCSTYATSPVIGCSANFTQTRAIGKAGAGGSKGDRTLARTKRALETHQAPQPKPTTGGAAPDAPGGAETTTNPFEALRELTDPRTTAARQQTLRNAAGAGRSASPAFGPQSARDQALDYLLGNDER